jgi:hypothetical protein
LVRSTFFLAYSTVIQFTLYGKMALEIKWLMIIG